MPEQERQLGKLLHMRHTRCRCRDRSQTCRLPSEIALTGQPAAHAPQEMHSSLIAYAKGNTSIKFYKPILTQNTKKQQFIGGLGKFSLASIGHFVDIPENFCEETITAEIAKPGEKKAYLLTLWHNPTPSASPHLSISNGAKG